MEFESPSTTVVANKLTYRWYQYRLRTLLLVTTLIAIGMSCFAVHWQKAHRQREIVKVIEDNGGHVCYEHQASGNNRRMSGAEPRGPRWLRKSLGEDFFANVTEVFWFSPRPPNDDVIRKTAELPRLESIGVLCVDPVGGEEIHRGTIPISDAGLAHLKQLRHLRSLGLRYTRITDVGLESIKGMSQLEEVVLGFTGITDAGLERLEGMHTLKKLDLSGTLITDDGLKRLKGITQLNILDLEKTAVTDEGLKYLQHMRQLECLSLARTQVTDAGLKHIQELNRMRVLDLSGTRVSDTGLSHLRGMRQLEDLNLRHTRITDAGLRMLVSLTSLRTLSLNRTHLTDAAIECCEEVPQASDFLARLESAVTDKGVRDLQRALPKLTVQ